MMAGWMAERARRLLAKPGRRSESPRHRGRHAATPAGGKASASSPPSGTGTGDRPARTLRGQGQPWGSGATQKRPSDRPAQGGRDAPETTRRKKAGPRQGLRRRWGASRRIRLRRGAGRSHGGESHPGTPHSLRRQRMPPKAHDRPGRRADNQPGQVLRKELQRRREATMNSARSCGEAGRASTGAQRGQPGWPERDRAQLGVRVNGTESPSSGTRGPPSQPSHYG